MLLGFASANGLTDAPEGGRREEPPESASSPGVCLVMPLGHSVVIGKSHYNTANRTIQGVWRDFVFHFYGRDFLADAVGI